MHNNAASRAKCTNIKQAPAYAVDLAVNGRPVADPEVAEYDDETLQAELEEFDVDTPTELSDFDRMVFTDEAAAEKFCKDYMRAEMRLKSERLCVSRNLPSLPYRRRYLALLLMGMKLQTSRTYPKAWKAGQLFNLHDRTHFVTVKLVSIIKTGANEWSYHFTMP